MEKGIVGFDFVDGSCFSDSAKSVWKELKETYDRIDGSIVFNFLHKINTFKQGGLPVSEYYHKLNSLWREFDILTKLLDCTCVARAELADHGRIPYRDSNPIEGFLLALLRLINLKLGHFANQVLKLSKGSLNLTNVDHDCPCEVCHKGKYTRESFPLSENKSNVLDNLYIFDVWGPYKAVNREGFSPYDDEEGPFGRDGSVHQPDTDFGDQARHNDHHTVTPIGENTLFEGTLGLHQEVPVVETQEVPIFENLFLGQTEEVSLGLGRSSRYSKFPDKLNE
nr:ribonuclease H-like domain-containing protein [Tanacetum cinerariifolium]